jgi:hypothetical protein
MKRWIGLIAVLGLATVVYDAGPLPARASNSIRSESLREMARRSTGIDARSVQRVAAALARNLFSSLGAIPAPTNSFDGLGSGLTGPDGTMTVAAPAPDPSADISPTHFVQTADNQLAVFDRTGAALIGPVPINTIWSGFGGDCEANNDGHATVLYDQIADRWVISQFSVTGANGTTVPYLACVAVSSTSDPAGSYARYAFPSSAAPVAPTLAAWPDAYYGTFDLASGAGPAGSVVCAYDRALMLNGQPATQQCVASVGGVLPADLDGSQLPAPGTGAYLLSLGADKASLEVRRFTVDWSTPANTALDGPFVLPVAAWTDPASPSVPQSGGGLLDPVTGRLARRVAYRTFPDGHASIVANHTVASGGSIGVRWYEIEIPNVGLSEPFIVGQQGTWSPDANARWVAGIAMDQYGNVALGYSVSSASLKPGLRYAGRLAGDPAGEMTLGEGTILDGAGAQDAGSAAWAPTAR